MAGKSVVVAILADTKKFAAGMDKAEGKTRGFGSVLGGLGKLAVAGLAAATVAAGGFIATSVKAAAAAQKVAVQTEAVLNSTAGAAGRTADQISKLAGQLSALSGIDDEVVQSGANVLLTFTRIKGANFDRATEAALNMSVALGQDLKSASILVGKALNDPIKGMSALSRAGVQLTDEQKELIEQLVATGDVAGAQAVLLRELETQFGGSAAALGNTFSGALGRVQTIFGNIQEDVGGAFLPMLTVVLNRVADFLALIQQSTAFTTFVANMTSFANGLLDGSTKLSDLGGVITGGIQKAADWLAGGGIQSIVQSFVSGRSALLQAGLTVFPALVDALVQVVPQVVAGVVEMATSLVAAVVGAAPTLVQGAITLFLGLVQGVAKVLPQIVSAVVGLIPVVVTALVGMVPDLLAGALALFQSLITAVVTILPGLISQIVGMLPSILQSLVGMIPQLVQGAVSLFMALVNAIPVVIPILVQAIVDLIPILIDTLISLIPVLLDAGIQLMLALVDAIPIIIPALVNAIPQIVIGVGGALVKAAPKLLQSAVTMFGGIISAVGKIGPRLLAAGGQLVQGLWNGITSVWNRFMGWWNSRVASVVNTVKSVLGIRSPSTVFRVIGTNVVRGLELGLGSPNRVAAIMGSLASDVQAGFGASLDAPAGYRAAGGGGATRQYVIQLPVGMPSASAGREIVRAIEEYERLGGSVRIAS